ncbi:C-C motif chemokine 3-like [Mantella aurantiaca]
MDTLRYKIAVILIIGAVLAVYQVSAAGMNPSDCCLATNDNKIPYRILVSYRHQGSHSGCLVHAIVFKTKKNRHLCASNNSDWVKKYMTCLDKNMKKC